MATLALAREQTSLGGAGLLNFRLPNLELPIRPGAEIDVSFSPGLALGSDKLRVSLQATAGLRLQPVFKETAPNDRARLDEFGLAAYFEDATHANDLLLLLTVGAKTQATVAGRVRSGPLSAGGSLEAGVDADYGLVRRYSRDSPASDVLQDLVKHLRLPSDLTTVEAGEVVALEYGGQLTFSADFSAGYELAGATPFQVGQLGLAAHYRVAALADLGVTASIGGRFRIEVQAGSEPGWARVRVRRARNSALGLTADLTVGADAKVQGLPEAADEFLSGLLGLKVQRWIGVLDQVRQLTSFEALQARLDTLARTFVARVAGGAFDDLADKARLEPALQKVREIAEQYAGLDDRLIALVDRYLDPATKRAAEEIEAALGEISGLAPEKMLKGRVDPRLWQLLQLLSGGDPLAALDAKGPLLAEVQKLALEGLELLRDAAHARLRDLVATAKSEFGLDALLGRLGAANLDPAQLKARTDALVSGFVERLLGHSLDELKTSELAQAVDRLHRTLASLQDFRDHYYATFKEALAQNLQFNLHAAWSHATEDDALLDFEVDLSTPVGRELLHQAGLGQFGDILAGFHAGTLRLHSGLLTHRMTRSTSVAATVTGSLFGSSYVGVAQLLVESRQRLGVDGAGHITASTDFELKTERDRRRNGERAYTQFVLGLLGQSAGVVELDPDTRRFLVDHIEHMSARYELVLEDPDTTSQELAQYLSFADDFGLAASDQAAMAALEPILPTDASGHYGAVSIQYDVRFTEAGLQALFKPLPADGELRRIIRMTVLATAIATSDDRRGNRAWAYWTPALYERWRREGVNFSRRSEPLGVGPVAPSPFRNLAAPPTLRLDVFDLHILETLYRVEDKLVAAVGGLAGLLAIPRPQRPRAFESALAALGSAFQLFEQFAEADNALFALLDQVIRRNAEAVTGLRNSSLTLSATVAAKRVTTMLVS